MAPSPRSPPLDRGPAPGHSRHLAHRLAVREPAHRDGGAAAARRGQRAGGPRAPPAHARAAVPGRAGRRRRERPARAHRRRPALHRRPGRPRARLPERPGRRSARRLRRRARLHREARAAPARHGPTSRPSAIAWRSACATNTANAPAPSSTTASRPRRSTSPTWRSATRSRPSGAICRTIASPARAWAVAPAHRNRRLLDQRAAGQGADRARGARTWAPWAVPTPMRPACASATPATWPSRRRRPRRSCRISPCPRCWWSPP